MVQASWAFSCEVAPAPLRTPVRPALGAAPSPVLSVAAALVGGAAGGERSDGEDSDAGDERPAKRSADHFVVSCFILGVTTQLC